MNVLVQLHIYSKLNFTPMHGLSPVHAHDKQEHEQADGDFRWVSGTT